MIVAEKIEGFEKLNHSWPIPKTKEERKPTLSELLKPKYSAATMQAKKNAKQANYWDD